MENRILTPDRIRRFEAILRNEEKSENTVAKYLRDLRCFSEFSRGKTVDKPLVLSYKKFLEGSYALSSANSMLAALNTFLRHSGWEDCCVKQFRIQKTPYCSEKRELSKADYYALVSAARKRRKDRLALLIQTVCGTGIRISEISYITVEAVSRGEAVVSCKGKVRRVFIVSALRKILLKYAKKRDIKTGPLFLSKRGKPLDRSNVWREMKSLCKDCGVSPDKVFPHNLRHLFARTFYNLEKDLAKLADLLGHSSINTTRLYIVSTGAEHRQKMENLHLIL